MAIERLWGLLAVSTLFIAQALPSHASESLFADLQWKHRILLFEGGEEVERLMSVLRDADDEIGDRQIVWLVLSGTEVLTNFDGDLPASLAGQIRKHYFDDGKIRAVLIGKDGGVKKRYGAPDLAGMLALIDTMPMRRRELQERSR